MGIESPEASWGATILGPAVLDSGVTTLPTLWRGAAKISGYESHTNNYAEYSGIINGLTTATHILDCVRRVHPKLTPVVFIECVSNLVVNQLLRRFRVQHPLLSAQYFKVSEALANLDADVHIRHIPRAFNTIANNLASEALDKNSSIHTFYHSPSATCPTSGIVLGPTSRAVLPPVQLHDAPPRIFVPRPPQALKYAWWDTDITEIDSKIAKLKRQAAPTSAINTLCLRRRFLVSQARKMKAETIDKVAGEGGGKVTTPPITHIITTDGAILTGQAAADKLAEYFASVHAEIHIAPGAPTIESGLPQLWSLL